MNVRKNETPLIRNVIFSIFTIITILLLFYLYNDSKTHPEHFVYECNSYETGIYTECSPPNNTYLLYQNLLSGLNWAFIIVLAGLLYKKRESIKEFFNKLGEVENGK